MTARPAAEGIGSAPRTAFPPAAQTPAAMRPDPVLAHGAAVGGAAIMWSRLRGWLGRHQTLTDGALAVFLIAAAMPPVSGLAGPNRALTTVLVIALAVPLIWRRRAPVAVFAVIFALALFQFFVSHGEANDLLPLLPAFYTVVARERLGWVVASAAALVAGSMAFPRGWGFFLLLAAFALLLGYYAKTRRAYIAALVDRAERLERERDQQVQLAAADERARIAREVHDIVAHNIAVMTALGDGAAYTAEASPGEAAALMRQASETGRSALAEMRRLVGVLRDSPGNSPQPALDGLDDLLASVRAAGLPAILAVTGQPYALPATTQLAIFRIVQESLTNTLKHAPGATARIQLDYRPGQVGLEITDTGRPSTVAAPGVRSPGPGGGHGIAGMRERAALFGGDVTAGPLPGGGWRVRATLRPGDGFVTTAEGT